MRHTLYMRSGLGSHFAGDGMLWDKDQEYDPKPHRWTDVKFEHDDLVFGEDKTEWYKLNGKVKTYKVDEI